MKSGWKSMHLGEASDPEESLHGSGALVSVHRAQLRPAQGQVSVAVVPVLVDLHVEGAVHGLELVRLPLYLQHPTEAYQETDGQHLALLNACCRWR